MRHASPLKNHWTCVKRIDLLGYIREAWTAYIRNIPVFGLEVVGRSMLAKTGTIDTALDSSVVPSYYAHNPSTGLQGTKPENQWEILVLLFSSNLSQAT
jgi:hypothetical protein